MDSLHNSISSSRKEYSSDFLNEDNLEKDPYEQFQKWLNLAMISQVPEPNAMTLSTVDSAGKPSSRIVLLRGFDTNGFVFFTNYKSRKGNDLSADPFACINFFWPTLERQVRIEGTVKKTDDAVSDEYFKSRPRFSQLGAWASEQSNVIQSRSELDSKLKELEQKFNGHPVPRPAHWGGYCLSPSRFEFWQGRPNRLHDRFQFELRNNIWEIERLSP
jgi:pyridoxamine 5'-phosphate oxidase